MAKARASLTNKAPDVVTKSLNLRISLSTVEVLEVPKVDGAGQGQQNQLAIKDLKKNFNLMESREKKSEDFLGGGSSIVWHHDARIYDESAVTDRALTDVILDGAKDEFSALPMQSGQNRLQTETFRQPQSQQQQQQVGLHHAFPPQIDRSFTGTFQLLNRRSSTPAKVVNSQSRSNVSSKVKPSWGVQAPDWCSSTPAKDEQDVEVRKPSKVGRQQNLVSALGRSNRASKVRQKSETLLFPFVAGLVEPVKDQKFLVYFRLFGEIFWEFLGHLAQLA
jgi:hypothetical protein